MQEKDISPRVERLNRAAAAEKRPDDPHAVEPRDSKSLIFMAIAALGVAVVAGTLMWVNNDGPRQQPIAEQTNLEAPQTRQQ